jgi:SAM-dependent methyltransferase
MGMKYKWYRLLQRYVHADYARQKTVLSCQFKAHVASLPEDQLAPRPAAVLELACGDGNLATVFPPESYLGLDLSTERIAAARMGYPAYQFAVCDVAGEGFKNLLPNFDFIFCHGLLHHLDDKSCYELLAHIRLLAKKPTTFVAIEPVLPGMWQNPLGFLLAKLDEGHSIRPSQGYCSLFVGAFLEIEKLNLFPRWPVNMEAYTVKYG